MNVALTWLDYQKEVFFDFPAGIKYKVIPKGRRAGFTRGAANTFIKKLIKGEGPLLWGDTINGNIQRYYERYFFPVLRANKITHKFDSVHKKLEIGRHYADFRSEDNPENWEGFAYELIYLNEAGIILKNRSLYINSVLPMMLDYPDSKLIAAGVPKGKVLKDGSEHPFYTLAKRADDNPGKYFKKTFTSYDNPLLNQQDIRDLEDEISMLGPEQIRQEIYGEFIEMDAINPFAHQWRPVETKEHYAHQDKRAVFDPKKQIIIHMDFNLNPMAIIFSHIWQDSRGLHDHQFDEMEIKNASIPLAITKIREKYGQYIQGAVLGGDYMGMRGSLEHRENWSFFKQIISGLNMSESQLKLVPNPTHVQSRNDLNYVLLKHLDFIVNPDTCPNTCRDMRNVQCDAFGQIMKKDRKDVNQRGDFLDCVRAKIAAYYRNFIDKKM